MQNIKVKGHSVQKIEWIQTDRQMGGSCITTLANAVGKENVLMLSEFVQTLVVYCILQSAYGITEEQFQ